MRRTTLLVTLTLLLVGSAGHAKDMTGRFGVGYEEGLGGGNGLALTYWFTNALGIDMDIGLGFVKPDSGDSRLSIQAALGIRYNIARAKDVNLGLGLRVNFGFWNEEATAGFTPAADSYNLEGTVTTTGTGTDNLTGTATRDANTQTVFQVVIDIPITVEYFLSEHFAISLSTGISFAIIPDQGVPLSPLGALLKAQGSDQFALFFGHGGVFGSAGFRFYF